MASNQLIPFGILLETGGILTNYIAPFLVLPLSLHTFLNSLLFHFILILFLFIIQVFFMNFVPGVLMDMLIMLKTIFSSALFSCLETPHVTLHWFYKEPSQCASHRTTLKGSIDRTSMRYSAFSSPITRWIDGCGTCYRHANLPDWARFPDLPRDFKIWFFYVLCFYYFLRETPFQ